MDRRYEKLFLRYNLVAMDFNIFTNNIFNIHNFILKKHDKK